MHAREVGHYLTSDSARVCFEELTTGGFKDIINPIDFFDTLEEIYAIIIARRINPINAIQHVKERIVNYNTTLQHFFLYHLQSKIHNDLNEIFLIQDEKLRTCIYLIKKELDALLPKENEKEIPVDVVIFDWRQTKTEPCHVLF